MVGNFYDSFNISFADYFLTLEFLASHNDPILYGSSGSVLNTDYLSFVYPLYNWYKISLESSKFDFGYYNIGEWTISLGSVFVFKNGVWFDLLRNLLDSFLNFILLTC